MGKFRIPPTWKEEDYRDAIGGLLKEAAVRYSKNDFDESSKMLIMAARIIKELDGVKKKETRRVDVNKKIKDVRDKIKEKQVEEDENKIQQPILPVVRPNNPFKSQN